MKDNLNSIHFTVIEFEFGSPYVYMCMHDACMYVIINMSKQGCQMVLMSSRQKCRKSSPKAPRFKYLE